MSDPSRFVHAIRDEALGNTSYVVEVGDGMVISIDPRRDIDEHTALSHERGLTITAVLEPTRALRPTVPLR